MKRLKRNCLYQYQGGGYDGCIWEWNFFLMNNKGKFIDLFSSGFAGIDTKQKAIDYINDNRNEINNDYYIINLKNKKDIETFAKETNEMLLGAIGDKVNQVLNNNVLYFYCTYCGRKEYPTKHNYYFDENNYCGDGGIGIIFKAILCDDCFCNTCNNCNSIINNSEKSTYSLNDMYLCEFCFRDTCKEILDGIKPLTIIDYYPENQLDLFGYSSKNKTISCNDFNKVEILEYLKSLGYEE